MRTYCVFKLGLDNYELEPPDLKATAAWTPTVDELNWNRQVVGPRVKYLVLMHTPPQLRIITLEQVLATLTAH